MIGRYPRPGDTFGPAYSPRIEKWLRDRFDATDRPVRLGLMRRMFALITRGRR